MEMYLGTIKHGNEININLPMASACWLFLALNKTEENGERRECVNAFVRICDRKL